MRKGHSVAEIKYRRAPDKIAEHLNAALASEDVEAFLQALGEMIRAQGVSKFAEKSGLRRETLYRSFSGKTFPRFDRVVEALSALDVKLVVKAN
jgi:probable addiction module antidote protein